MHAERSSAAAIRSKIWIEAGGDVVLSEWRIDVLAAIEETGSLTRAAERLDVPYRTAWERVREMERRLGRPLVETVSGGADGGGSQLSPFGRDLVARWRRAASGVREEIEARFRVEFGDLLG
jgi:molybdate transport system regulatory protein